MIRDHFFLNIYDTEAQEKICMRWTDSIPSKDDMVKEATGIQNAKTQRKISTPGAIQAAAAPSTSTATSGASIDVVSAYKLGKHNDRRPPDMKKVRCNICNPCQSSMQ